MKEIPKLDEEASLNFFNDINQIWIRPEVEKRRRENRLPKNFKIIRCLIKLPIDQPAIVLFNSEIELVGHAKAINKNGFVVGQPIYLHDIERIENIDPPKYKGERVAFVFLFFNGKNYSIIFDFSPNAPKELMTQEEKEKWMLGEHFAQVYQDILKEYTIIEFEKIQTELQKIGLWAAPSIIPYPLSKIVELVKSSKEDVARNLFIQYCNYDFIKTLVKQWCNVTEYEERKDLFEECLSAHQNKYFHLSISTLLPHIEGVITDRLHNKIINGLPFRQESKTKKLRDYLTSTQVLNYTEEKIINSTFEFILKGPVLSTFKSWYDAIDNSFPSRHPIEHGKYRKDIYNEENSIKVFLMLDTFYQILKSISKG